MSRQNNLAQISGRSRRRQYNNNRTPLMNPSMQNGYMPNSSMQTVCIPTPSAQNTYMPNNAVYTQYLPNPRQTTLYTTNTNYRGNVRRPARLRQDVQADAQVISKVEKWFDVIKGVHKYVFYPGESGIPHLDRFSSIYENYQLRHFEICYRPSSGTTVPGNITLGVDYNPSNERKAVDIPLLSPNISGTVYSGHSMTAVINRVMKGNTWLYTAAAGNPDCNSRSFALYVDAQTEADNIGQIWVSYRIAFCTATSPTGSALATPIAVCTSSTSIAGTTQVIPADVVNVSSSSKPIVSIETPSTVSAVTSAETGISSELTTVLNVDADASVGSTFTAGALITPPDPSLSTFSAYSPFRFRATPPKITFKYLDGTDVPTSTIQPLAAAPVVAFSASHQNSDIFATLFKILKPLAGPVLGYLKDLIDPAPSAFSTNQMADEEIQTLDQVPDSYTVFAFEGDEAVLSVPNVNVKPLAAVLSTNLMLYCGVGVEGNIKGFIEPGDANIFSQTDNWVSTIVQKGSGNDKIWDVTLESPDKTVAYHVGDLIVLHFTLLGPLDHGFTNLNQMHTSTISSDEQSAITTDIVKASYGVDTSGAEVKDVLILDFVRNNSSNVGFGVQTGLTMGFRLNNVPDLKKFNLVLHAGKMFSPSKNLVDSNIDKPEKMTGYALMCGLIQLTIFPTALPATLPRAPANISMQRISTLPVFKGPISEDDDEYL